MGTPTLGSELEEAGRVDRCRRSHPRRPPGDHGRGGQPLTLKRVRRIEGQVRGVQRVVDEDTYCIDVLTQVSAITSALQSVAVGLLDEHVRHCVRDAAVGDDERHADEMVTEATRAIERLVKT
jgi:CsoR family transcriptional regulator, copper-sensing transcriptional repressor